MRAYKAGWVVVSHDDIRRDAAVLVDAGRIVDVVDAAGLAAAREGAVRSGGVLELEDLGASILMPGLVNAHMHQYGVLSHGIPQAKGVTDFDSFLRLWWWPDVEDRVRAEQVLATTEWTMAEQLRSGVTSFCDILEAPYCEPDTLVAQGEAIERAGMRAVVSLESSERAGAEVGEACLAQNVRACERFAPTGGSFGDDVTAAAGLVRGAICTHTTFTCPEAMIARAAELAREQGALLQFHLCESRYEGDWARKHLGVSPVDVYERAGALGPATLAAQCVKLTAGEIATLAAHGVQAAHPPISNCEVGGGIAPVPDLVAAGMEPGLGTDGYVNDMFQVMREACLIHKAARETTSTMPAGLVFRMATEWGARAMGLGGVGILRPGQAADMVAYADAQPTPVTEGNVLDQLVVFGDSHHVSDVWVAGRRLMEHGELTTIDEERARDRMRSCAKRFWEGM